MTEYMRRAQKDRERRESFYGTSTAQTLLCYQCGAAVPQMGMMTHMDWHDKLTKALESH